MVDYRVSWKEAFQPNLVHWLSRDETYRDVTFVCQGEKMSFHQSFLSLHSPYLKTLIERQPCSMKKDVIITLEDVNPNILKKLMKVLYTGCCVVEPRENHEILVLMKMLDIKADIMFKLIGQNELDEIMIDIEMEHLKLYNSAPQNISPIILEKIGFGSESFIRTSMDGYPDQDSSHDMNKSEVEGDKSDHENGHEIIKSGNLSAISNEPNAIIALSDTSLKSVPDAQNDQAGNDFEILREYTDRFPDTNYTLSDYFSLAERRVSMELSRASDNFLNNIEVIENIDYSKDLFATYFEELARKNLGIKTDEEYSRILSPDLQNNKQPSTLDISTNLSPIKSLMASSNSTNLQMMTTNFSIEEIPESPSPIKSLSIGSINDLEKEKTSKSSEELLSYCLTQPVSPVDQLSQSSVLMESLKSSVEQMSQMSESSVSMKSFNNDDHSGAVDNSSTKLSSCTLSADTFEEIYKSSSTMKSSASSSDSDFQQQALVEIPTPSSFDRREKSSSSLKPLVLSSKNNLQLANVDYSRDLFATYLDELARNNCEDNPCILSLGYLDVRDAETSSIEETSEFSIDKLPETSLSIEHSVMDSRTNLQGAQLTNPLVNVTSYNTPQSTSTVEEMSQSSSTSCLQLERKDISYVDLTNYSNSQASSIESSATSLKSDHHLVTKYNSSVVLPLYISTQSANNFNDISKSSSSAISSKSNDHMVLTVSDISSSSSTIKSSSTSSITFSKSSKSDHKLATTGNSSDEKSSDSLTQSTNTFDEKSKSSSTIRSSVTPTKGAHELVVTGNSSVEPPSCILSIDVEEKANSSSSIKSSVTPSESDYVLATTANSSDRMPKSTKSFAEISRRSSVTKAKRNTRLTTTGSSEASIKEDKTEENATSSKQPS